jgi:predicted S18 family serine protease
MQKRGLYLIIFVLVCLTVSAGHDPIVGESRQMKLLAVKDVNGNFTGSIADLFIELREGSSRIFLETYPLTKMDTQISTRFAKEMACDQFKLDCSGYDFIYTIKATSDIIGGPSAGAAVASLTAVTMLGLDYDPTIAITGTINSGGIIGPVGGVRSDPLCQRKPQSGSCRDHRPE